MIAKTLGPLYVLEMLWDLYPWAMIIGIIITMALLVKAPWKGKILSVVFWLVAYLFVGILIPMFSLFWTIIIVGFFMLVKFLFKWFNTYEVKPNYGSGIQRNENEMFVFSPPVKLSQEEIRAQFPKNVDTGIHFDERTEFSAKGTTMTLQGIMKPVPELEQAYEKALKSGYPSNVQNIIDNAQYFNQG
jgi:hypothetical protein